tara:strand:- start:1083 stop:1394 length:312 start_codon:yes stop_codon:yes gene_type:complete
MAYDEDSAGTKKPKDVKSCLKDILATGTTDPDAIVAALEKKGFSIISSEGPGADPESDPDMRPERNPPEGTGGDTESAGEPMSLDQIGEDLMREYMGGDSTAS